MYVLSFLSWGHPGVRCRHLARCVYNSAHHERNRSSGCFEQAQSVSRRDQAGHPSGWNATRLADESRSARPHGWHARIAHPCRGRRHRLRSQVLQHQVQGQYQSRVQRQHDPPELQWVDPETGPGHQITAQRHLTEVPASTRYNTMPCEVDARLSDPAARDSRSAGLELMLVIPALNESATIRDVVCRALQYVRHIIVIDDGSTDG